MTCPRPHSQWAGSGSRDLNPVSAPSLLPARFTSLFSPSRSCPHPHPPIFASFSLSLCLSVWPSLVTGDGSSSLDCPRVHLACRGTWGFPYSLPL